MASPFTPADLDDSDAVIDAALAVHGAATSQLQFELYCVDRELIADVLAGLPPSNPLLEERREIVAKIDAANDELEQAVRLAETSPNREYVA
tara:strand:- start:53522 stop:53797 length:276 start_codon:yes stop_codon:yes gene_type:complete